ncbi:hypothetical protein BJX63DRAFT_3980 [Aspergillus granulosus]|uniref:Uncharacterized protein n=1 Tax=Aspergillus granulosus TaxID=176169 RepID=A0ABR4I5K6_9EURO
MRAMEDPFLSSADMFLLEHWQHDSNLSDEEQRERIFAEFVTLGVDGQQRYRELQVQRGVYASRLAPEERQLLDRVRQPTERFTHGHLVSWIRTAYEPLTEPAFSAIASALETKFGDQDMLLNNPHLYHFGDDWQRIFLRAPQLLQVIQSAAEYRENLEEALHPESESDVSDIDDDRGSEYEFDYTPYHWAMVVGRIHIVDRITLGAEGPNAGKVLIVFYDACGRVVRSYRETVDIAADITAVDNALLDENPCWGNGEIGPEYRWGGPLGPPYV